MERNRCITFKDMTCKEVINICNGKRLGNIFNAELDSQCNKIIAYLVKEKRIEILRKEQIYRIPIRDIRKIGKEIILVEISSNNKECNEKCFENDCEDSFERKTEKYYKRNSKC